MFIETETTPNPKTLKFIPDRPVLDKGTFHFTDREAAKDSPLAASLFSFPQVSGVLLAPSFVSVSLTDGDWAAMKGEILSALLDHFTSGRPAVLASAAAPAKDAAGGSDLEAEIKTILDEKVRPAVARDGGDITFAKFENGVVYLHLKGACAGCPSSIMTLKQGIENLLKYYIPEVTEVRAV